MSGIRIERDASIATLFLDRPPVNAIDNDLLDHGYAALADLARQSDLRALVVTGAGRCFSAGLDLKLVPHYSAAEQRRTMDGINRLVAYLYALPIPTIAAINGHAIAGGLIVALACDQRIASSAPCKIGLTEARAGVPFPAVAMAVLRAELAPAVARRLTLTARNYGPDSALADGILDTLHAPEQLLAQARTLAADLAAIPADAYARIKHQLRAETIAFNRTIVDSGRDPLAAAWLSKDAGTASAALLHTKGGA